MNKPINLAGQWIGKFVYGPEYGDEMHGEKVGFRFFLEHTNDGQFTGTSVDVEGYGTNMDTATIKGFLDGDFISFTKEYPQYYQIGENGERIEDTLNQKPSLNYSGYYNYNLKSFSGNWEFWNNEKLDGDGSWVDIFTGTWEMFKDT